MTALTRSTACPRREETFYETLPPTTLVWPGATPEQLDFMRRVYEAHIARSKHRGGKFVGDVPKSGLATVEGGAKGPQMRTAAAADCRAMLQAARKDLAAERAAGSARVTRVQSIGINNGYRSASYQRTLWQRYFPRYYGATQKTRAAAPGGPHGSAAVTLTAAYVGKWIAAPGYSLHNDGRAVDLATSERGVALGPSAKQRTPWRETWFWHWLVANAARYAFFQNTSIDEPWHWEHRPERLARESEAPAVIPSGEKAVSIPLLAPHGGSGPNLFLRWNTLTRTDEIDVVVHFHGFSCRGAQMRIVYDMVPVSGLDWRDPDLVKPGQRTRPTLFILPRGKSGGGESYTFPALYPKAALNQLIAAALSQLASTLGLSQAPRVARRILTAHSGGGLALRNVLANPDTDPDEVHLYDGTYWETKPLADWARRRIDADARASSGSVNGALRVFFRPGTKTAGNAGALRKEIVAALHGRPNAAELATHYRVEEVREPHTWMPRRYGWQLFINPAADVT